MLLKTDQQLVSLLYTRYISYNKVSVFCGIKIVLRWFKLSSIYSKMSATYLHNIEMTIIVIHMLKVNHIYVTRFTQVLCRHAESRQEILVVYHNSYIYILVMLI